MVFWKESLALEWMEGHDAWKNDFQQSLDACPELPPGQGPAKLEFFSLRKFFCLPSWKARFPNPYQPNFSDHVCYANGTMICEIKKLPSNLSNELFFDLAPALSNPSIFNITLPRTISAHLSKCRSRLGRDVLWRPAVASYIFFVVFVESVLDRAPASDLRTSRFPLPSLSICLASQIKGPKLLGRCARPVNKLSFCVFYGIPCRFVETAGAPGSSVLVALLERLRRVPIDRRRSRKDFFRQWQKLNKQIKFQQENDAIVSVIPYLFIHFFSTYRSLVSSLLLEKKGSEKKRNQQIQDQSIASDTTSCQLSGSNVSCPPGHAFRSVS